MSIEMAPKSSTVSPAKAVENTTGKRSADEAAGAGGTDAGSFLSALACAEEGALAGASDGGLPIASVVDGALPTDDEFVLEEQLGASDVLVTPAFLLTQVPVAPSQEVVAPGGAGTNAPGAGRSKDGSAPLPLALDPLSMKSTAPPAKSGKAALDAASEVFSPLSVDNPTAASAGAFQVPGKDTVADRAHHTVQGLAESLLKTANVSTLSLSANKDRLQEVQSSPKLTSDISAQAWAAPQGAGGVLGSDGVLAGAAASAADGQFSEQVSYWIGTDVQKAEMTLDGFGANPVEVSISMQGREATVMFRTDEAFTREALSNASEQLQDAMGRQGVVLSGVSVGTSNSGDSQRQGTGGRQSGWKSGTVQAVAEGGPATSVKSGTSGRSIDLFV